MIRATDATRRPATTLVGRSVAGLAIAASLTVAGLTMAGDTAVAATGSPAPHTELCYLIDLYQRAEPDERGQVPAPRGDRKAAAVVNGACGSTPLTPPAARCDRRRSRAARSAGRRRARPASRRPRRWLGPGRARAGSPRPAASSSPRRRAGRPAGRAPSPPASSTRPRDPAATRARCDRRRPLPAPHRRAGAGRQDGCRRGGRRPAGPPTPGPVRGARSAPGAGEHRVERTGATLGHTWPSMPTARSRRSMWCSSAATARVSTSWVAADGSRAARRPGRRPGPGAGARGRRR